MGCPLEPGCPAGWVRLSTGCYQFLEVDGGVGVDKAEYICKQFGAHLIDINDVEEKWRVFKYFKEEVMNRECFEHGKGFWIMNTYEREKLNRNKDCLAWIADPYFARDLVEDNYIISNVSCDDTLIGHDIYLHPLCEKDVEEDDDAKHKDEEIAMVTEPSILKSVFTALFSLSSQLFRYGDIEDETEGCKEGFTRLATGCYLFTKESSNYEAATLFCEKKGSEVLRIDSEKELAAVEEYLKRIRRDNCNELYGWWSQDNKHLPNNMSSYSVIR